MQRGGSIKTSILQSLPPQTTVQCAGAISAQLLLGGRCSWDSSYNVNKKKKKSVCSRTQICSWNLCVNCWKYCWVLSKSTACVMVDLIFICSFKPLISCWGWTAWNSFICFDIWGLIFPVTAPALPVLPNYEGNRRIKFLLLISVFACYTSGASLRRLRGA